MSRTFTLETLPATLAQKELTRRSARKGTALRNARPKWNFRDFSHAELAEAAERVAPAPVRVPAKVAQAKPAVGRNAKTGRFVKATAAPTGTVRPFSPPAGLEVIWPEINSAATYTLVGA